MQLRAVKYSGPQHALFWRNSRRALSILLASLLGIVLFGSTAFALVYRDLSSSLNTDTKTKTLLHREEKEKPPSDGYAGRAINVLVIGSDWRDGVEYNDDAEGMRADTTVLFHISADRSRVLAVSIPRDTVVEIPPCDMGDGTFTGADYDRFNHAFSFGGMKGDISAATACTIRTTEILTGLTIDEFVVVDMTGMEKMIDSLGGVNLWSDIELEDPNTNLVLQKGCNTLNGRDATSFVRIREGVGDGSDLSRMQRQQRMMGLMYRTAMKKNLLTEVGQLYSFGREGLRSLTTSEGLDLTSLAGLAYSLSGLGAENLLFVAMPNATDAVDPNRVVPVPQADEIWQALALDLPLPAGVEVRDANGKVYTIQDATATSSEGESETQAPEDGGDQIDSGADEPSRDTVPLADFDSSQEAERKLCEP